MEFQNKLKALRTQRGVSQQALADAIYVSRSAVAKWENGLGYPSADCLTALAGYFGVTENFFRTEEPERIIVRKNSRIRILAAALVLVSILTLSACGALLYGWFSSADGNDTEKLAAQAEAYLGYEELEILKTAQRGDYMAALCRTPEGKLSLCVYERHWLFRDRWQAVGAKYSIRSGELTSWNAGIEGDAILIFCGGELPEEICWYTFENGGITYTCPVEDGAVLDIFLIPDHYDINAIPQPLDENKEPLY